MGGRSLWGSLLDSVCQRYGWTFEYVMWGLSWLNLQMMMADAVDTIFPDDNKKPEKNKENGNTGGKMGWEQFLSAMHGISNTR